MTDSSMSPVAQLELDALPRLDTQTALDNMAGMHELYEEVASIFMDDASTELSGLDTALAANDMTMARRAAHTIKGMAGSLGASRLQKIASAAELACSTGAVDAARSLQVPLQAEFEATCAAVRSYLATPHA